jgi:hypothetical protein
MADGPRLARLAVFCHACRAGSAHLGPQRARLIHRCELMGLQGPARFPSHALNGPCFTGPVLHWARRAVCTSIGSCERSSLSPYGYQISHTPACLRLRMCPAEGYMLAAVDSRLRLLAPRPS